MERKRSDIIADELESLILDGSFSDGARLDESQLAERFKVSRTPLREAFQRLALSGLAEQIPRRGVFVRQPGPVELIEMFEVMAALEALCGELAAARITDAALDELRAANLRCQQAVEARDTEAATTWRMLYESLSRRVRENGDNRIERLATIATRSAEALESAVVVIEAALERLED